MITVILITSSRPRVGKSVLAKELLENIPKSFPLSFALPIKNICYSLYETVLKEFDKEPEVTLDEYCQSKKEIPLTDLFTTTPRHQYCEGSQFLTDLTCEEIWGELALHNIKKMSDGVENPVFIIDDWRRPVEFKKLESCDYLNCITIYLDREGMEEYTGTEATEAFEGKINPQMCDRQYTYKENWENYPEVIQSILNLLGKEESHAE